MTAQPPDLKKLREVAERATPQDFDSAQIVSKGGWIECPGCGGEGWVELTADYCNYDDEAIGVQFYGVGQAHVNAEEFYRNFNPQTILALLDAYESSARDAERYRWLRQPNALRRAAHIAVLTHNGGFVACEEQADQAIDAARHATQGD